MSLIILLRLVDLPAASKLDWLVCRWAAALDADVVDDDDGGFFKLLLQLPVPILEVGRLFGGPNILLVLLLILVSSA